MQAGHIDAFRNGTAFSMAIGKWETQACGDSVLAQIDFAGSILAWVNRRLGCIQLKCMVSGQKVSLYTPMQQAITHIAMSDTTIVAVTFTCKCCAWDLSAGIKSLGGQSPKCIETSVVYLEVMVVSGSTIVLLDASSEEAIDVTTWDIKCRQLRQFQIKTNRGADRDMYSYFAIVTHDERSLVLFERVFDKSNRVRFIRMDLKGQVESSGSIEHPDIEGYSMHSERTTPVYTNGMVTL